MLKNTLVYYLVIFCPLIGIIYLVKMTLITPGFFVGLLFFYAFVYRKVTDVSRLIQRGVLTKQESAKYYAPWRDLAITHFKSLYL